MTEQQVSSSSSVIDSLDELMALINQTPNVDLRYSEDPRRTAKRRPVATTSPKF
jgi:hypothetical protein